LRILKSGGFAALHLFFCTSIFAARPWAAYEPVKNIFLAANPATAVLIDKVITHLPEGVNLILISTDDEATRKDFVAKYLPNLPADKTQRFRFSNISPNNISESIWIRDFFPFPLVDDEKFDALGAHYWRGNTSRSTDLKEYFHSLRDRMGIKVGRLNAVFLFGNLLADKEGRCFFISDEEIRYNYRAINFPEPVLTRDFGCTIEVKVPFQHYGIGHIDEILTLVSPDHALVTHDFMVPIMEAYGYKVELLPKIHDKIDFASYANSFIVNDTVFIPRYGKDAELEEDKKAVEIYAKYFKHVVPVPALNFALARGGIHCVTAAYPRDLVYK